jgi:class 3 adenylate cyclase
MKNGVDSADIPALFLKHLYAGSPSLPALEKRDRDVTVLFLGIAGYARLSEHNRREAMHALVERDFSSFLDAIYTHNGDITKRLTMV